MTVRYAVTFEFDLQPPITHRGTVSAGKAHTVIARAVKEATRAHPGLRWTSMVCVLLERLDAATDSEPLESECDSSSVPADVRPAVEA
jgi:hypothetical protein